MYQDLGDTYSEQRDEFNDARCAVAMDFSAAAAYYAASSYIFLINFYLKSKTNFFCISIFFPLF